MKRDIENRPDIEFLIDAFYKKVLKDKVISHFFTEVEQLDWEKHIPIMYNFWESILFGGTMYKGNPMIKHVELNKKKRMTAVHFDRWLELWVETIHENFRGLKADEAINRAKNISQLMMFKVGALSK